MQIVISYTNSEDPDQTARKEQSGQGIYCLSIALKTSLKRSHRHVHIGKKKSRLHYRNGCCVKIPKKKIKIGTPKRFTVTNSLKQFGLKMEQFGLIMEQFGLKMYLCTKKKQVE